MGPTWLQNGSHIAPRRPLGAFLAPPNAYWIVLGFHFGFRFGPLFGPNSARSRSQLLYFRSCGLQDRSKRLSRGSLKASATKMQFGTDFRPVFGAKMGPRDLKINKIEILFWNPLISLLEPKKSLEPLLGGPRRISRRASAILGVKRLPERSPGGSKMGSKIESGLKLAKP